MTTCRILLVLLIALMLGVSTGAQQPGPGANAKHEIGRAHV
jgi:hypothetical protein